MRGDIKMPIANVVKKYKIRKRLRNFVVLLFYFVSLC